VTAQKKNELKEKFFATHFQAPSLFTEERTDEEKLETWQKVVDNLMSQSSTLLEAF